MGIKKGTKLTDNPKDTLIRVRMDKETVKNLDYCVEKMNSNRSSVIRDSINKLHNDLKKKNKKKAVPFKGIPPYSNYSIPLILPYVKQEDKKNE